MLRKDLTNIGDMYGSMLNEARKTLPKGGKNLNDKDAGHPIKGGASKAGGFNNALDDDNDLEEDEEVDLKVKKEKESDKKKKPKKQLKESKNTLNTDMKKPKSIFDKLYAKVLNENFGMEDAEDDIDALGLGDATPDSDLEDDFGGDDEDLGGEEETVTLTIDKTVAQTLIDLLQAAVGGSEDEFGDEGDMDDGSVDDDLNFDDTEDEDNEDFSFDEDEEDAGTKVMPDKKKAFQSKNNKVGGKVKAKKTKASGDVTDDVGEDGDFGTAISSPKKPDMGTQNKVSKLKQGQEFFQ